MPISSFGEGLQKAVMFLPGTYGTSLLRNHALNGVTKAMVEEGIPINVVDALKDLQDRNLYFGETLVEPHFMYIILLCSIAILITVYVLLNKFKKRAR